MALQIVRARTAKNNPLTNEEILKRIDKILDGICPSESELDEARALVQILRERRAKGGAQ
jgi:hypothetical protein